MKNLHRVIVSFTAAAALVLAVIAISGSAFAQSDNASDPAERSQGAPGDTSFLTGPAEGNPLDIALEYIQANHASLGLSEDDLTGVVVTDLYTDAHNGVTHIYLQQRFNGVAVYGAVLSTNIARDGSVINLHSNFVADLASAVNTTTPAIGAEQAVESAAASAGLVLAEPLQALEAKGGEEQAALFSHGGISLQPIPARLRYQPVADGAVRLAWEVEIYTLDSLNYWVTRVDAQSGKPLDTVNWVVNDHWGATNKSQAETGAETPGSAAVMAPQSPDAYRVYAIPVESPNHASPPPPADARTLEVDPANSASPFAWHDTNGVAGAEFTITQGNNANAYRDADNNNLPDPGSQPDGGAGLNFDFPINLGGAPSTYIPASVTNLFYWNNIIHDVLHSYGFNEASGSFQEDNYGNGGTGSDSVNAEAQDGGGNCNANFFTPADGSNPRMQMYNCTNTTPARDGSLDNAVIIHEYGHGISNRLTGGPANVSCLQNAEQAGEGWSDWYALMLTQETGDLGTDSRGMGTYLFGQPANGPGIRPAPYSTNFAVNNYTYGDIGSLAIPHGVGFVWATMAWEMTWELIADHGFNPDIYDAWSTGGNNLAMQLVTDGLKLQPCSPGFVDARNGILSADMALTGGANQCAIWEAFARRGLGFSASQGSSSNTNDGTEAFDTPPSCTVGGAPIHVGDLDGSSAPAPRNKWNATVTVTIHDEDENPVANAAVSGTWSNGASGSGSCTTNAGGQCSVTKTNLILTVGSVDFSVDNVTEAGSSYEPSANHDPDGDSDGSSITVFQVGGPPGDDTHHVGDLDGSSLPGPGGRWTAVVTVSVHDQDDNPVAGAAVSGAWSSGVSGSGSCTTNASGQCEILKTNLRATIGSVDFTVSNVSLAGSSYAPATNHDPDGDSNGTTITISQF